MGKVTRQAHGHNKYGRTIGDVTLPDGHNVNHTRSKLAGAGGYRKYPPGNTLLEALEN
jgi:hypothetical protein